MDFIKERFLFCLILYLTVAEACLKKSEPDSGSSNGGSNPGPPTVPSGGSSCNYNEEAKQRCLNGGTCYVTIVGSSRITHCICQSDYEGSRCESKKGFLTSDAGVYNVPAIIGIVVAVVILSIFLAAIAFFFLRKRVKDGKPKFEAPYYTEDAPPPYERSRSSNFAASKHFHEISNKPNAGYNDTNFAFEQNNHTGAPPYTISGSLSTPSKRSGVIVGDSDEKDNHSSRPSSSTGGSLYHTSGVTRSFNAPLAFHETTI